MLKQRMGELRESEAWLAMVDWRRKSIFVKENTVVLAKGSVSFRCFEKKKFENLNFVHRLFSVCSSMFKVLYEKNYRCS